METRRICMVTFKLRSYIFMHSLKPNPGDAIVVDDDDDDDDTMITFGASN